MSPTPATRPATRAGPTEPRTRPPNTPAGENLFHIEFVVTPHYDGRHLAPTRLRDPEVGEHSGPGIVMAGLLLTDFGERTGTLLHYHVEKTPYKNGAPMAAAAVGQIERACL